MDRRAFLGTVVGGVFGAAFTAQAQQQPGKVSRVGFLVSGTPASAAPNLDAFRQRMRDLGYVEGRNIAIEFRYVEADPDRYTPLAAELVRLNVDVIVAMNTPATRAAKQATSTIPIVMVSVGDAVGAGLVASFGRPGGNITGTSFFGPETAAKGIELLKEAAPKVSRVAVLWNPDIRPEALGFQATEVAARTLGVTLQSLEIRRPEDLDLAFAAMARSRPDALIAFTDPVNVLRPGRIVDFADRNHLPTVFGFRAGADAGGLMSYGPNQRELARTAAAYVDKILKGTKPADLPVEQPTKFELVINLKTAKALGLTIPQSLLLRADEIIQ